LNRSLLLVAAAALGLSNVQAQGQASPTARRLADIQVGGGVTFAKSDYVPNTISGFAFYGDLDLRGHYGLEFNFHQVRDPNADPLVPSNHFSERTYEVGGRYLRHYNRFAPYGKVLYGRGVANFRAHQVLLPTGVLTDVNNIAYNMGVLGVGVDYRLTRRVNLRADFEYQHWFASDAELPNGLTPKVFTVGAAYHFPARGPFRLDR
jgi:opacity protein-like surface antigen